jgi:monofunctional biosynthetic peptidoglycan transglycosylase
MTMTTLFEFENAKELDPWRIVNDGVMGGLSQSNIEWDKENGTLIFSGNVSLENYGGFASTRTFPVAYNKGSFKKIIIRVKGDGKTYKFRMRNSNRFDGIAYSLDFDTQKDKWEEIEMMVEDFEPTFRGRIYSQYGKMDTDDLQQVGFLIAGKQEGEFRLEVDWIRLGN